MSPLSRAPNDESPSFKSRDVHAQDSEESSDSSDEEESVKKKFEGIRQRLKDDTLNLRDPQKAQEFIADPQNQLGRKTTNNDGHKTFLHMLVKDAKDEDMEKYRPLVELFIERYPELLVEKDDDDKTPLHNAIKKGRDKLVRLMCDTHRDTDAILSISSQRNENCLHIAIRQRVDYDLTEFLIGRAGEKTLCGQDKDGNTPLHLAVDYNNCTDAQLKIVEALVDRCDKAMDVRTRSPDCFSPYRFHEHTRKREADRVKQAKQKEAARGKDDNGGAAGGKGSAARDGVSANLMPPAPTIDSKALSAPRGPGEVPGKVPGNPSGDWHFGNPSGDWRLGKFQDAGESHGAYGLYSGAGGGESKNSESGFGLESGKLPVTGLRRVNGLELPVIGDRRELDANTPVGLREGTRRKEKKKKVKVTVTEGSADVIREFLKLHCMRKMTHDEAVDFLYGRSPEKQIFFDLFGFSSPTISEGRIRQIFNTFKFEDVLQYVAIPNIQLEEKTTTANSNKSAATPSEAKGRRDMVFFFQLLREKGVKRVIRVIVDDTGKPEHSDEAIEKALAPFKIEVWDWRKFDLCTETIRIAAPDVREVFLYWSGNNAVLRGWSEPEGLKLLDKLEKVYLHVEQGLEGAQRTRTNVKSFRERLKRLGKNIVVEDVTEPQIQMRDSRGGPVNIPRERMEHRHRWLTCMDQFADFIQNVARPLGLHQPVTVALIDDGVDINDQSIQEKIINGRSFGLRDRSRNLNESFYVTNGGHGAVMASLICRVCPMAKLYVLKLDEYVSEHSTRQITAESAARAVQAAIDERVDIISMSWTIERTDDNANQIEELKNAISNAAAAGILMFCAANDQGIARDDSFPAFGNADKLFKIGAAGASGSMWKWVGDPAEVDFIFPGQNVVRERPKDAPLEKCNTLTGSSVATAIAAGLAALVLCCVQLAALHNKDREQPPAPAPAGRQGHPVGMDDFYALKKHERMKEAFHAIGTSPTSGHKYIEVWDVFGVVAKPGDRDRLDIVADIAQRLKQRKTM